MRIPLSVLKSQHGERLRIRSEKRVVKRAISNLFVKVKGMDTKIANLRLQFEQDFWFLKKLGSKDGELGVKVLGKVKGSS